MKKDLVYSISCLAFAIVIGGGVYEHMNMVPKWAAAPPASLSMFQGEYGLNPAVFWMTIHPVNLLLFATSLVLHWRSERRKNILTVLVSYFAILVITWIYFVPELISITSTAFSPSADEELIRRAKTWEVLSLVRLAALMILAIYLFRGLTKASTSRISRTVVRQAVPA